MNETLFWRTKRVQITLLSLTTVIVSINAVAAFQAYKLMHFVPGASKNVGPENMSIAQKCSALIFGVDAARPENEETPSRSGLAFTTVVLTTTDNYQIEVWKIEQGDSRGSVVMCHGYAGCKGQMLAEAEAFYEMGFTVILLDFRGSGGSSGSMTTLGFDEAQDVVTVANWAVKMKPRQPLILYGQSMGGAAILRALANGEVRPAAIIVECVFDELLQTVKNRFQIMGIPGFPLAELLLYWGSVETGADSFALNPVDYAKEVNAPMLVMLGSQDKKVTVAQGRRVFDSIHSEKQLCIFPHGSHEALINADPSLWHSNVRAFLYQLPTQSPAQ